MLEFKKIPAADVDDSLLKECQSLFNEHYGKWSDRGPRPGEKIKRSIRELREYLCGESAWLAVANDSGRLIGYGMVAVIPWNNKKISWVTQLVVHRDFQNQKVGTRILYSAWLEYGCHAWGIASANPYAIRALEKATRRFIEPVRICKAQKEIKEVVCTIPYFNNKQTCLSSSKSVIDTEFYQDISSIKDRLANLSSVRPWILGAIKEGQEWFGMVFSKQKKAIRWTEAERERFLEDGDNIARQAYDRMAAVEPQKLHPWASPVRAKNEVDVLIRFTSLNSGSSVLDFGCGAGRHSRSFAALGYKVTGIDFSKIAINLASKDSTNNNPNFSVADCRSIKLDRQFDLGVCLYDVIGSFPSDEDNIAILRNLVSHVKVGGYIAISVMSYKYMLDRLSKFGSHIIGKRSKKDILDVIDKLPASSTMETSGDIFAPEFTVLDERSRIFYRREHFRCGNSLPEEFIVRDRRYEQSEIKRLCESCGIKIEICSFVNAGNFEMVSDNISGPTKEILVIGRKQLLL